MRFLALLVAVMLVGMQPAASTEGVNGSGEGDSLWLTATESNAGDESDAGAPAAEQVSDTPYTEYRWVSVCAPTASIATSSPSADCQLARSCADALELRWQLWGRLAQGGWIPLGTQCFGRPPGPGDTPRPPDVGPGDVLTALRRIGLPALEVKTQPEDKTLVNFETIFYAEPETFARTMTLLGQRVEVEATPSTYTWHHGDGTSTQTGTPGARYPAKDVIHEYTDAHVTVTPSVDVTYSARFRVNGGAWQGIPETVTISGPAGSLRIAEATAVLSGSYD